MPDLTFALKTVLVSDAMPLEYTKIALTAAVLLVLLALLYHVSANRKQVTEISEKLSLGLNNAELSQEKASKQLTMSRSDDADHLDDYELAAVLTAAIAAYESGLSVSEASEEISTELSANTIHHAPVAATIPKWDAPTTAGFRIRSIKRVS